ncbi:DNA polymerase II [Endozoicomonas montiporae]|uniref:DNA polymerase II n=1 Tax=Endozoicomonas montiporae TaxID=1027273 RepID=UPI0009E54FB1|nr:DNA polymerase II [Endozoicomonas montiporae]
MDSGIIDRVIMIGEPQPDSPDWIQWVNDELSLLKSFEQAIEQRDPDIIIGWNVINFDCRLLLKRSGKYGITLKIGRNRQAARWRERSETQQGFITVPGRIVIDGIDALKSATYQFDSFSLEAVARQLLAKGKDTEDVDNRMAIIEHDFHHNKVKLANYNLQDCRLVEEIFDHTRVLDFLRLRSQLTGLELDRLGGSVAAFSNQYLPKLHRAGYIAPNLPENGGLASPGGYVMDSRPGLYRNVLVLDFKSLYPSIIRTFKIDPVGLVEGLKNPDDTIPGFRGARFSRDNHFLPGIITSLWLQRDEAKKQKDSARSQAIKILMNSFYGVLGSGGCRFYDTRLASSITLRGHEIMQQTARWIEAAGYQVIYGDTDSTFVLLEASLSPEEAEKTGQSLARSINDYWQQTIGIGWSLAAPLLPQHPAYGSVLGVSVS